MGMADEKEECTWCWLLSSSLCGRGEGFVTGVARLSEKIKSSRFMGSEWFTFCSDDLRNWAMPLGGLALNVAAGVAAGGGAGAGADRASLHHPTEVSRVFSSPSRHGTEKNGADRWCKRGQK